jgi:putative peptidoglycan lipid II flippase
VKTPVLIPPVDETEEQEDNRQIARAAGVVMIGFVLSSLAGLLRQVMIANVFGTEGLIDTFYAATVLPDTLFALVAGGALASAFIPTFTGFLARQDRTGAWNLASAVGNLVFVFLTVLSAAAWFFALPIVETLIAPEFTPVQQALTAEMLRILLLSQIILGVSGLLMGILNSHQSFLLPALAPTFYWLGIIFGLLMFVPVLGIHGLAWGTVLGAGLHLGIQLPGLFRLPGRQYRFSLGLENPSVRLVGRLIAPRLLGAAVVHLNFWVGSNLASGMVEGSLTAYKNAYMVMMMPQAIIAQSISIAALPTLSAQFATEKLSRMRASLASALRSILFLSLPAALGLILLREPVISLLFERGEFDARSVELTAWALLWFAVGLVSHSVLEIIVRAFYAMQDTRTPVAVGVAAMSLNVVFSLTLTGLFEEIGWMPHGALALANSLATSLEAVVLLVVMRRRLHGLEGCVVLVGSLKALLAVGLMSAALAAWLGWATGQPAWLTGLGGIAVGGLVYGAAMLLLGVDEVIGLVRAAARRFRR